MPLTFGLLAVSDQLPGTVFGSNWVPMVPFIKVLAVYSMLTPLSAVVGQLFMAVGRPKILLFVSIPQYALEIALLFAFLPFGVIGICYAVVIPMALFSTFYFILARKQLRLSVRELVEPILRPAVAAAAMFLAIDLLEPLLIGKAGVPAGILLAGFVVFGFFFYTAASLIVNRKRFRAVIDTGRSILVDRARAAEKTGM
jgi:PST family polysaccharide transporter